MINLFLKRFGFIGVVCCVKKKSLVQDMDKHENAQNGKVAKIVCVWKSNHKFVLCMKRPNFLITMYLILIKVPSFFNLSRIVRIIPLKRPYVFYHENI